ncbi:MAG: hypothetical protein SWH78_02420 [Thermodesulfobacteriota bacterium]|nr:hypothetical protein [Thermodesulfobacteriota bacterium]
MKKIAASLVLFTLLVVAHTSALAQAEVYKIGPGNVLEISVWKDEALFSKKFLSDSRRDCDFTLKCFALPHSDTLLPRIF